MSQGYYPHSRLFIDSEAFILSYTDSFDQLADLVRNERKLIVIGSTHFWGEDSSIICQEIGRTLAQNHKMVLVTGGVPGVGETLGRCFYDTRIQRGVPDLVYHILPHGETKQDYCTTLFAGESMFERREILGRFGCLYLCIEGGPRTEHEAQMALENGAKIIPVARTGGFAAELYDLLSPPDHVAVSDWHDLQNTEISAVQAAQAIDRIVQIFLSNYV